MGEIIGKVDGAKIEAVNIYHENLFILTEDGRKYFLKPEELLVMMNEFLFDAEFKRTRTWLHPVTPDVDLLYDQDKYPKQKS